MDELERRILDVFSGVRSRYKSAEISVFDSPRRLRLSSTSPDTAAVEIIPDPGQVDIAIGREGRLELLNPRSIEESLRLVHSIADAVAEGRYEETRWTILGRTVRSSSFIRGGQDAAPLSQHWGLLGPVPLGRKTDVRYAPYA